MKGFAQRLNKRGIAKVVAVMLVVVMAAGCANTMRGSKQQLQLKTYDAKTGDVIPCDCVLKNDEGVVETKSTKSVFVGRDKDLLTVDCQNDEFKGSAMVDGKVNAGYWAIDFFVIDLCLISCWVDGLSGAWAEYPEIIDVPMNPKND